MRRARAQDRTEITFASTKFFGMETIVEVVEAYNQAQDKVQVTYIELPPPSASTEVHQALMQQLARRSGTLPAAPSGVTPFPSTIQSADTAPPDRPRAGWPSSPRSRVPSDVRSGRPSKAKISSPPWPRTGKSTGIVRRRRPAPDLPHQALCASLTQAEASCIVRVRRRAHATTGAWRSAIWMTARSRLR
jgi:hypothetical protein